MAEQPTEEQKLKAARSALAAMRVTEDDIAPRTVQIIVELFWSQQQLVPAAAAAPGAAADVGPVFCDLLQASMVEPAQTGKITAATNALKAVSPALPSAEITANRIKAVTTMIWSQLRLYAGLEIGPLLANVVRSDDPDRQQEIAELNKKHAALFTEARSSGGTLSPDLQTRIVALNEQAAELAARVRRAA
jgi:hypothetical protein